MKHTLLFNKSSFADMLTIADYIKAVEHVHALHAKGEIIYPDLVHADAEKGEFHIKTGGIKGTKSYFGLKANGGFFNNTKNYGLPNILGLIYLASADNAYPLAIFSSSLISKMRTAAATAVAAKYLAPKKPVTLSIIGYGTQADAHIEALHHICDLKEILISGRNDDKAKKFADHISKKIDIPVSSTSIENCCLNADILVTCTPSREFIVKNSWINEGVFIAAIGCDSPGKNELEPTIIPRAKIVADIKKQIIKVGETQHAINKNMIKEEDIYAELGELIAGQKSGRISNNDIFIYDSTGTALQDVAVAAYIYEKLKDHPDIQTINFYE